jgi:hypothetical protein
MRRLGPRYVVSFFLRVLYVLTTSLGLQCVSTTMTTTTRRCGMTTTAGIYGTYGMSFFIYHLLLFSPNCSYSVDLSFLPLPLRREDVG